MYDGGLRVPAIAHWPARISGSRTSQLQLDFTDVHATVLAAAGLTPPTAIDGRSFLPPLVGSGPFTPRPFQVWYLPEGNQAAVLAGKWKATWRRDSTALFDIERDPSERLNRWNDHPEIVARLDSIRRREDRRADHPHPSR